MPCLLVAIRQQFDYLWESRPGAKNVEYPGHGTDQRGTISSTSLIINGDWWSRDLTRDLRVIKAVTSFPIRFVFTRCSWSVVTAIMLALRATGYTPLMFFLQIHLEDGNLSMQLGGFFIKINGPRRICSTLKANLPRTSILYKEETRKRNESGCWIVQEEETSLIPGRLSHDPSGLAIASYSPACVCSPPKLSEISVMVNTM
ncbi:unnamed protein product [Xylocopa violacea]|uniref:Uncharacterized protein n=1 Tax=Xylocopa violacea TaxID=135666 RepID=A0ABP1PIN6_XYLVO